MASVFAYLLTPVLVLAYCLPTMAQPAAGTPPLSVDEVLKLCKGGISEDLIIIQIKKNGKAFNLSSEEVLELKNSGVSENIIKYLLDPSQPYSTPPPPPPAAAAAAGTAPAPKAGPPPRKFPDDEFAGRVPPEPGLYRFPGNTAARIELKMFLGESAKPGLGKVLMKKGKVTAYMVGPASKLRIAEAAPMFYVRLPEGKGIEELLLVSLDRKNDRRELDMGPPGPKPELRPETMRQFDSLEVASGVFRLTPNKLDKGEYAFFLIGTAEPAKGNYGKGYDFGIDAADAKKRH